MVTAKYSLIARSPQCLSRYLYSVLRTAETIGRRHTSNPHRQHLKHGDRKRRGKTGQGDWSRPSFHHPVGFTGIRSPTMDHCPITQCGSPVEAPWPACQTGRWCGGRHGLQVHSDALSPTHLKKHCPAVHPASDMSQGRGTPAWPLWHGILSPVAPPPCGLPCNPKWSSAPALPQASRLEGNATYYMPRSAEQCDGDNTIWSSHLRATLHASPMM